jgi:hypothetical protein
MNHLYISDLLLVLIRIGFFVMIGYRNVAKESESSVLHQRKGQKCKNCRYLNQKFYTKQGSIIFLYYLFINFLHRRFYGFS